MTKIEFLFNSNFVNDLQAVKKSLLIERVINNISMFHETRFVIQREE